MRSTIRLNLSRCLPPTSTYQSQQAHGVLVAPNNVRGPGLKSAVSMRLTASGVGVVCLGLWSIWLETKRQPRPSPGAGEADVLSRGLRLGGLRQTIQSQKGSNRTCVGSRTYTRGILKRIGPVGRARNKFDMSLASLKAVYTHPAPKRLTGRAWPQPQEHCLVWWASSPSYRRAVVSWTPCELTARIGYILCKIPPIQRIGTKASSASSTQFPLHI